MHGKNKGEFLLEMPVKNSFNREIHLAEQK